MRVPYSKHFAAKQVRNELLRALPHLLKAHQQCALSGFPLYGEAVEKLLEITRITTDLIAQDTAIPTHKRSN